MIIFYYKYFFVVVVNIVSKVEKLNSERFRKLEEKYETDHQKAVEAENIQVKIKKEQEYVKNNNNKQQTNMKRV